MELRAKKLWTPGWGALSYKCGSQVATPELGGSPMTKRSTLTLTVTRPDGALERSTFATAPDGAALHLRMLAEAMALKDVELATCDGATDARAHNALGWGALP